MECHCFFLGSLVLSEILHPGPSQEANRFLFTRPPGCGSGSGFESSPDPVLVSKPGSNSFLSIFSEKTILEGRTRIRLLNQFGSGSDFLDPVLAWKPGSKSYLNFCWPNFLSRLGSGSVFSLKTRLQIFISIFKVRIRFFMGLWSRIRSVSTRTRNPANL